MFHKLSCVRCGTKLINLHKWDICGMCGPMVRCGYCGNNCCNGGTSSEIECLDRCESAYAMQDKEIDQRWEDFKNSEGYVKWEQDRENWRNKGEL